MWRQWKSHQQLRYLPSPQDHHATYLNIELLPLRDNGGSRVSSSSRFDSVGINENRNMMDDVLIANRKLSFRNWVSCLLIKWPKTVPEKLLRSALRTLVSQGSGTQQPFVQHIREHLTRSPPELTPPSSLFPVPDEFSAECNQYLEITRCIFSSKLSEQSLT